MKEELLASLSKMIPNGNRLELPQEQLSNYPQVKKCLLTAGGKYKRNGFDFTVPGEEILGRLLGGEAINDKKKFQFFATPAPFAKMACQMADIQPGLRVLEPSAGQGAIANEIRRYTDDYVVVELMPENVVALTRQGYDVIEGDFLAMSEDEIGRFDRIVGNPPFAKGAEVDHIRHMYTLLKPGGKMVTFASSAFTFRGDVKYALFLEWLTDVGAVIDQMPEESFKSSGTNVSTMLLTIDKPVLN